MTAEILEQLARNTGLLPDSVSAAILAGITPNADEILMHLLIAVQDAHAVIVGDPRTAQNVGAAGTDGAGRCFYFSDGNCEQVRGA
jgi:hypothetical protein